MISSRDANLVFPPVVNTNFGQYYPSTAVLAAYCAANGFTAAQADWNEDFCELLVDTNTLVEAGRGSGAFNGASAMCQFAGKTLLRFRHLLFDSSGRHRFADESGESPAYLLNFLAEPFLFDDPLEDLLRLMQQESERLDFLRRFFHTAAARLGEPARLVGFSVAMGPQLLPALIAAQEVREQHPGTKIVFGGPAVSLLDEVVAGTLLERCRFVDAIVRYEGERPLVSLLQQLSQQSWCPEEVPGVISAGHNARPKVPAGAPVSVNALPFARFESAILDRLADPEIAVLQSRGCYWGECAYCDFIELYKGAPPFRSRKAELVLEEIQYEMGATGSRRFTLITEAISPGFARRFSKQILEHKLDVRWNSFAMVDDRFSLSDMQLMREAGCEYLVVGLEAMDTRALRNVRKYSTREMNVAFIERAIASGIRLKVNLIPDLPMVSREAALSDLIQLRQLASAFEAVAIFPFEVTKSSAIGRSPEVFGITRSTSSADIGQAQFAENHFAYVNTAMSSDERVEVLSAYNEFADEVNARLFGVHGLNRGSFIDTAGSADGENVPCSDHEWLERGDGLLVFNWRTRRQILMPLEVGSFLELVRDRGSIGSDEASRAFANPDVGSRVVSILESHGVITRLSAGRMLTIA